KSHSFTGGIILLQVYGNNGTVCNTVDYFIHNNKFFLDFKTRNPFRKFGSRKATSSNRPAWNFTPASYTTVLEEFSKGTKTALGWRITFLTFSLASPKKKTLPLSK